MATEEKCVYSSVDVHLITKGYKISNSGEKKENYSLFSWIHLLFPIVFVVCFVIFLYFLLGSSPMCVDVLDLSSPLKTEKKLPYFGQIEKNMAGKPVKRKTVENGFEYSWGDGVTLLIKQHDSNCTSVTWRNSTDKHCFDLTGAHWYGGGELYNQIWPLEGAEMVLTPFYPLDIIAENDYKHPAYGPVLGRYWITSNGSAILVNQSSPLLVSINAGNDKQLCFTVDPTKYPDNPPAILNYMVCKGENVKDIHQAMLTKFFRKPSNGPDEIMMRYPVWSTWVKYHKEVTQDDVEQFLAQIVAHNFSCSQIEIDDMYSTNYGDYDFDPVKFPNPKELIDKIHESGCRVTAWAHPFANLFSKAYDEGKAKGYFVVGPDNITSGLVYWWNGIGAAIDFTNPGAKEWYLTRLRNFQQEYGIDSFKFDAGSVTYLPYRYQLNDRSTIPSNYSVAYATIASEINNMVEVRVGDNSQHLPIFVRFLDRDSTWSSTMGLKSVIPTVLTFGILGYPFILPDMIGGNGNPDKQLFIRWLQLNAFLPAMQFSLAPWDFDNETIAIASNMMKIREAIFPTLLDGVSNAVKTGEPIIRPLWWIDPDDPMALTIKQQFMVMDDYLVAPVTQANVSNINVYLPKGKWMEQFGNKTVHTITNTSVTITYPVTLSDVLYFKNVLH